MKTENQNIRKIYEKYAVFHRNMRTFALAYYICKTFYQSNKSRNESYDL